MFDFQSVASVCAVFDTGGGGGKDSLCSPEISVLEDLIEDYFTSSLEASCGQICNLHMCDVETLKTFKEMSCVLQLNF